jgi:hypothetical protein
MVVRPRISDSRFSGHVCSQFIDSFLSTAKSKNGKAKTEINWIGLIGLTGFFDVFNARKP